MLPSGTMPMPDQSQSNQVNYGENRKNLAAAAAGGVGRGYLRAVRRYAVRQAYKEKEPPVRAVNYTIEFTTVLQAVYLGDKYRTGDGNYRLTLTNADGDVLEADLTSVKAPKPSAAMPTP